MPDDPIIPSAPAAPLPPAPNPAPAHSSPMPPAPPILSLAPTVQAVFGRLGETLEIGQKAAAGLLAFTQREMAVGMGAARNMVTALTYACPECGRVQRYTVSPHPQNAGVVLPADPHPGDPATGISFAYKLVCEACGWHGRLKAGEFLTDKAGSGAGGAGNPPGNHPGSGAGGAGEKTGAVQ